MIRRTMEFEDENELIAAEQAVAMARELKRLADAAPDGHVLAVAEMAALERGRRFTRDRLQGTLNAQAAASLVDKILDWRDTSPLKRLNGAKDRDYHAAGLAYRPRNGPFQSIDELRLVMGMNADLFARVEPALTVYSGRPSIDPQVAPREALLALPGMDESKAADLIAARAGQNVLSELAPDGRAFAVSARIERADKVFGRAAIIRMTNDPARPFWILSWKPT